MNSFAKFLCAFSVISGLALMSTSPAVAQSGTSTPEILLEEGTKKVLRAFELFIMTIPQYEMPEVLPNGDIILRRKNSPGSDNGKNKSKPPSTDETRT